MTTEAATVVDNATAPTTTTTTPDGQWFEHLDPTLKVEKSLQSFKGKGFNDVVKSYVEAQRLIGSSLRMPKADAPPEEQERFLADVYAKLGRPETPDKYEVTDPTVPPGTPWDKEAVKQFLSEAHKAGLNSKQAQALLHWYGGRLSQGMEVRTKEMASTERALRDEWGNEFDRKLTLAQKAAGEIGGKDFVDLLETRGLANHPVVVRTLAAFGETLAEVKLIDGDLPGSPTITSAQQELQDMISNPNSPYRKGDQAAANRYLELQRMILGSQGRKVLFST